MKSVLLITYILLFSLGCVGSASIGFLHKCLKVPLTKYLLYICILLLASVGRILLDSYLATFSFYTSIPSAVHGAIGFLIALVLYYLLFRVLTHMKNISLTVALVPTALVFIVQMLRTIVYYTMGEALTMALYPVMIALVSWYLFFVGFAFWKGIDKNWNQALQILIRRMGLLTMIFAPISAALYISLHIFGTGANTIISLDFLYLGIWSLVSVSVVLHYLTRIGTIPDRTSADQSFLENYAISPREAEVLELILQGFSNKEIGNKLCISFTTSRTHVSHIFEKTGVSSRMELVAKVLNF